MVVVRCLLACTRALVQSKMVQAVGVLGARRLVGLADMVDPSRMFDSIELIYPLG